MASWVKETNPSNQSVPNMFLGEAYLLTKEYDKALTLFNESLDPIKKKNINRLYVQILLDIGKAHAGNKNYRVAFKYAEEGLTLAKNENIRPMMIDGNELLSEIYHHLRMDDKAYIHLRQHTILKDSVLNRQFLWRLNNHKKAAEDEKKKAAIELLNKDNTIKDEQLNEESLLKKIFFIGLVALIVMSVFIFRTLKLRQKNEKLKRQRLENELIVQQLDSQKRQAELRQQATELEMKALRAQMSPHFIFNCLSSINRFILKNESEVASDYLTRFSRLIRLVLSNSKKPLISLEDELEMVRLYIEMERLRFKDSFDFNICFKSEIDISSISIPPLLLQPFAENAIWHGLMNKDGKGQLDISFGFNESMLICTISDNGIGRKKADELKSVKDVKGKSMGLQITTDRLSNFNKDSNSDTFFEITDIYDSEGHAAGTKVILKIRIEDRTQEALVDEGTYA